MILDVEGIALTSVHHVDLHLCYTVPYNLGENPMRFSDTARQALVEAKNRFGSYAYNDKGADEVMDVNALVRELKKLPIPKMSVELKHLSTRTDCPLDPAVLLRSLLGSLDEDETYASLFEDPEIAEYY